MKSIHSVGENTTASIFKSVRSMATELWKYLRTTDKESIVSDVKDTWLLWKTIVEVYAIAVRTVLKRGPGIVSDLKKYPWLLQLVDLRNLFRSARGRKGAYRKATLNVFKETATSALEYLIDVLKNPDRVVHIQASGTGISELCRAMGLIPYMDMSPPVIAVLANPRSMEKYMDFAESEGIPADVCSLPRCSQGLLFKGESPKAAVSIGNNNCEGQVNASLVYTKKFGLPTFMLDAPNNFKSERAEIFYGKEIMRLVEWLEENTPGKMDWDLLREIMEEKNRAIETEMELWEMTRIQPSPLAGEALWFSHLLSVALTGGMKRATEMFEMLVECAKENMKNGVGAVTEERFRAVIWHAPMATNWHAYRYLEVKWGVSVVQECMMYTEMGLFDTSSNESMLRGIGRLMLNAPMANFARGPSEYYLDPLFSIIKQWGINLVLVGDHIGCKSVAAMTGLLREKCRQQGIPVVFVPYDLMDKRSASWEDVANRLDQFMETIMKVEPLRETVPAVC